MCDDSSYLANDPNNVASDLGYITCNYESLSNMTEPVSAIASSIGTTFKLADFCLRLQSAPDDVRIFALLIDRVRKDLRLLRSERHARSSLLSRDVSAQAHIDETISDTESALVTIGKLVEGGRVDGDKGRQMTLAHRFAWVLKNKVDFITHQSLLATCHQSLCTALSYLHALPADGGASLLPSPPTYDTAAATVDEAQWGEFVRSPSARRPPKKRDKEDLEKIEEEMGHASSLPSPPATGRPIMSPQSFGAFGTDAQGATISQQPPSTTVTEAASIEEPPPPTNSQNNVTSIPSKLPDPASWDTGTRAETLEAAATAIRGVGGDSTGIASIADSLSRGRGGSVKERRRMRQAIFAERG